MSSSRARSFELPEDDRATSLAIDRRRAQVLAHRVLSTASLGWFVVAIAGQLLFASYVVGFYGRTALAGQREIWNKVLPHGDAPGDPVANAVLATHLALAALIIVSGAVQLTPGVRRVAPVFHRWNGRLYIVAAMLMGLGGLTMVWTGDPVGDRSQHVGISVNAAAIIVFALVAWRRAVARRFDAHRRWALRLFLAVGGVWFFRIGLMA